jgi:hypothetical protein
LADRKEEGNNQGDTPKGKHGGGGSVYDWRRVKEIVLGSFDSHESPFLFLAVFCLYMQENSAVIG